jgi:hypothetical protein
MLLPCSTPDGQGWDCCAAAAVETCAWGQTAVDGYQWFCRWRGGAALVGAVVQVQNVGDGMMTRATTEGKSEFLLARACGRVPRRGGVCVASLVWRPILAFISSEGGE